MTQLSTPFQHEYGFQYEPIVEVIPIAEIVDDSCDELDVLVIRGKVISVAPIRVVGNKKLKI